MFWRKENFVPAFGWFVSARIQTRVRVCVQVLTFSSLLDACCGLIHLCWGLIHHCWLEDAFCVIHYKSIGTRWLKFSLTVDFIWTELLCDNNPSSSTIITNFLCLKYQWTHRLKSEEFCFLQPLYPCILYVGCNAFNHFIGGHVIGIWPVTILKGLSSCILNVLLKEPTHVLLKAKWQVVFGQKVRALKRVWIPTVKIHLLLKRSIQWFIRTRCSEVIRQARLQILMASFSASTNGKIADLCSFGKTFSRAKK